MKEIGRETNQNSCEEVYTSILLSENQVYDTSDSVAKTTKETTITKMTHEGIPGIERPAEVN